MKKDKLDKIIEQEYYKQAIGKQISVMDIPKVFRDVRASLNAASTPQDLQVAVGQAVTRYCK